jgi:hypothetical protein
LTLTCNSKLQSADYYDRVSRGVYVQSGFEPDKFGRGRRHVTRQSGLFQFEATTMDFRGLELLNGLSISTK